MHQPTTSRNEISFITNINILNISALESHPHGFFQIKGIQGQHANRGMDIPNWND